MASHAQIKALASQPALRVRLFKTAYVLLTLLSLAACAAPAQQGCYWPQSYAAGCHEIIDLPGQ